MKVFNNLFNNFFDSNQKISFYFLLCLMLFSSILEIIGISLIVPLISTFFGSSSIKNIYLSELINFFNYTTIYNLLIIFGLVFFLKFLFMIYFYSYQNKFIYKFKEKLSNKLFYNYLNKNYSTLRKNSAILLSNIINEVDFATSYLDNFSKLILDLTIVCFLSIFLLYYNFNISLSIILVLLSFIVIYLLFFKKKIEKWGNQRFLATNKRIQYLTEGIQGSKIIKITNSENFFYKKFIEFNELFRKINIKIMFLGQVPKVFLEFLGIATMIGLIIFATVSSYKDTAIIELLGIFLFAFFKIVPSLNRIMGSLQMMRYIKLSVNLINEEKVNQNFSKNIDQKISFDRNIIVNIKNFIFYNDNQEKNILLKDINLNIKKNDKIGIIGPSGSGKSTFLDIFSGLIELNNNESIVVDDNSINKNYKGWQQNIGYVPQKTFIIEDTFKNNILFGLKNEKTDDTFFNEILSKANLNYLVTKLPDGIETIIKEDGSNFSGGEIQRIGLARALIRRPKILILDESTSALDFKNEEEIIQDLLKIKNLTIISVTHRLSALKGFDKIYNLKNGTLNLV